MGRSLNFGHGGWALGEPLVGGRMTSQTGKRLATGRKQAAVMVRRGPEVLPELTEGIIFRNLTDLASRTPRIAYSITSHAENP